MKLLKIQAGRSFGEAQAVRAAMIYDWSSGQVEGNVNRLKMIKRMMFGRAGFAMLKARVLHRSG